MNDLRLDLDTTDFKKLVELGRSMIPAAASGWTDHNIHDPGVMLMELVAWVADAQTYALSRTSRGEREAFGQLLGLDLTGPRPARGLIWPLAADAPIGTPVRWPAGTIVGPDARVTGDRQQAPAFFPTHRIELTTAELIQVATRFTDGTTRDWTRANSQRGATFLPFGESPRRGDTLALTLRGTLIADAEKFGSLSIGFEIPPERAGVSASLAGGERQPAAPPPCSGVRLTVSLRDALGEWPVTVQADTTAGLSRSGVLLLDVDPAIAGSTGTFLLSIRSESGGFLLPPRVQRIALNVLPVEQLESVDEPSGTFGTDTPGQTYALRRSGLVFPLDDSFRVEVSNGGDTLQAWARVDDLGSAEPDAAVYSVDEEQGTILFGNGINGRRLSQGAQLRVRYRVTEGARGNLPRGIQWTVRGVPAPFGINSEDTSAGADPQDLARLRAVARQHAGHARPIVTARDLEQAALRFTDLRVRRAHELVPGASPRRLAGGRVLVAVGPHDGSPEADRFEESAVWLSEIRRRLTPQLPLGQSLDVIGPRLVDVQVLATLVAAPQVDPDELREEAERTLRANLTITSVEGAVVWPFGRDLTALTVKGWLRNVEGVARVVDVRVRTRASDDPLDRVELGVMALPRLRIEPGDIAISRPPLGGRA
jgi:hypothetical protein